MTSFFSRIATQVIAIVALMATAVALPPSDGDMGGGVGTYGVSAGLAHTCARLGRNLVCFGHGLYGQLGTGATDDHDDEPNEVSVLEPVPFATTDAVEQVSAGSQHTCVLFSNGGVRCFGYGLYGQLGTGSTANVGDQANEMSQLGFIAFSNDGIAATQVSAGEWYTCVLFANGGVRCFGYGSNGQLGTGSTANVGDLPNQMSQLGFIAFSNDGIAATQVSAGNSHTCVLFVNGGVRCFGAGGNGNLGTGSTTSVGDQANQMSLLDYIAFSNDGIAATQVSAGHSGHTCVLFANGGVRCFGHGFYGQLGRGNTARVGDQANQMSQLDFITFCNDGIAATQVSAGGLHTCVLFANGGVRCFGHGFYGQLGRGSAAHVGDEANEMSQLDYIPIQVIVITALSPTSGHFSGGEPLTIYGSGFISTIAFSIRLEQPCHHASSYFNGTEVPISATHAIVTTTSFPCGPNNTVRISLSRDGDPYTDTLPFVVYDTPYVSAIEPDGGPTSGATLVTLYGDNLILTTSTTCTFGNLSVSASGFDSSTSAVICPSPTIFAPEIVAVELALNERNYTSDAIPFRYHDAVTSSVSLPRGPVTGATPLAIQLNGTTSSLINFQDPIMVRFVSATIDETVPATLDDTTHVVTCLSPDVTAYDAENFFPHTVQVSVSLNGGQQFTPTSVPFEFYADPSLISITPPALPLDATNAIPITLLGTNFLNRDTITVRIAGSTIIPATFHPATGTIRASIPPATFTTAGARSIAVSLNSDANVTPELISVSFFTTLSALPRGGPMNGGTRVAVTGAGLVSSLTLACRFGTVPAPATFVSSTRIECLSPLLASSTTVTPVPLDVTVDGTSSTSSTVLYTYHPPPVVTVISPAVGPSGSTGSSTTLSGTSFPELGGGAKCRFGSTETTATSATSTSIVCPLPSTGVGSTPVYLALNGVDFATDPVGTFAFYAIFSVEPSLGPTVGGTAVIVSGSGFDPSLSTWRCRFGGIGSPWFTATAVSTAQIACTSPATTTIGATPIAVSGDTGATSATDAKVEFTYFTSPTVAALTPSSGPSQGGTTVTITGANLVVQQSRSILCKFGAIAPVTATSLSPTSVPCTSPGGTGTLPVEISLNGGLDFSTSAVTFAYFELTQIDPVLVSVAGGSEITVTGTGFTLAALPVTKCRFGSTVVAASKFIDTVRVVCIAPEFSTPSPSTAVAFSTNDGAGFATRDSVTLAVFATPQLTAVTPAAGPSRGGTVVTVTGTSLPESPISPQCRFETTLIAATITSNTVTCTAPPGLGAATLQVTFNGKRHRGSVYSTRHFCLFHRLVAFTIPRPTLWRHYHHGRG
jgi:alpha-tubulin suppressor-like RCC1 family protein